jgi:hypothetical protein
MHSTVESPTLPDLPALELRCREAEWIDRPETLVEFSKSTRHTPMTVAQRYAAVSEVLVADAFARAHFELQSVKGHRVVLTCETPRFGIPLGVRDLELPPVHEWQVRDRVAVDLLDIDPHGRVEHSVAMQMRRALIAVAGTLPLLMTPMLAHAGTPSAGIYQPSLEQLATFAPPTLPEQPTPPVEQPTSAPAVEQPPPPTAAPPAPKLQADSLSLTGTNLWNGLLGKQVRLEMKGGQAVTGVIVAQSSSDLAVARTPDGTVVAVPKAEVAGVRLRVEAVSDGGSNIPIADRPTQNGRGAMAGGIVMVSAGSILALTGTVFLGITPSALYLNLPLLLPGLALIGGGSALIASGGKKKKAYDKAWGLPRAGLQMTPTFGAGPNGGAAGLVLRF